MIRRRCHLGDRACVSNFALAASKGRGHGRGCRRRGSGQASERNYDEEEACREVNTLARKAEIAECWALVHPNILVFVPSAVGLILAGDRFNASDITLSQCS